MQRGCANANIDMSIVLYIVSLSMVLQQLNRITHGYGVSYDVIRWLKTITPKTKTFRRHCQQHHRRHRMPTDCTSSNIADEYPYRMLVAGENQRTVNNESVRYIMRWKPPPNKASLVNSLIHLYSLIFGACIVHSIPLTPIPPMSDTYSMSSKSILTVFNNEFEI